MNRYILSRKVKKLLETRGYKLMCKECGCPIMIDNIVQSVGHRDMDKRTTTTIFYHAKCYDEMVKENG